MNEQLDAILDEQRQRWQHGERVFVEAILQRAPEINADRSALLDLIYNEFVLRESLGDKPDKQDYLRRFPHLQAELTTQFEVDDNLDWQMVVGAKDSKDGWDKPGTASNLDATNRSGQWAVVQPPEDSAPLPAPVPPSANTGTPFPEVPGYTLIDMIGRGGAGVVYRALEKRSNRPVAVKVLVAGSLAGRAGSARFCAEMEHVARLRHPNIARVHQIYIHEGTPFVAMELGAANLAQRLTGQVKPRLAAQWLETIARTIHFVHQHGVVHGNLRAASVLLDASGSIKVSDFGIENVRCRLGLAPPDYLAPEQVDADLPQPSPSVDVYGLGTILHELLMGRAPLRADQAPSAIDTMPPHVPPALESICLRCLERKPADRYASAEALAQDLHAYLMPGEAVRASRPGIAARVGSWLRGWSGARAGQDAHERMRSGHSIARQQMLLELTRRLMWAKATDDLLPKLAETMLWLADADRAVIYLHERGRDELRAATGTGEVRLKRGAGIAGAVAVSGEPIHLSDAHADPRFAAELHRRAGVKTRNLLALPIIAQSGILGVVELTNKRAGPFNADDIELLSSVLASAVIVIERSGRN